MLTEEVEAALGWGGAGSDPETSQAPGTGRTPAGLPVQRRVQRSLVRAGTRQAGREKREIVPNSGKDRCVALP